MYLIFTGEPIEEDKTPARWPTSRRTLSADRQTLTFAGLSADPGTLAGPIHTCRDDGFVLAEDNISGYARRVYSGGMLTYTNVPEPEPQPEPEPEPTEVEQLRARVADLQHQILTMRLGG